MVSLFQSKAPRFVRGWSLESISQSVESTEEHIIGELQAVRSQAQGPGTGTRDRRERGDDLNLEIEDGGVNISDLWRSPISSFRCPAALVAYCPFSFCASSSACLKSFLIECHVRPTVESGIPRLGDFGRARNRLILLYLRCQLERE